MNRCARVKHCSWVEKSGKLKKTFFLKNVCFFVFYKEIVINKIFLLAQKGKGVVCNAILSLGTKFAKNISKPNFLLKMFFFTEIMSAS